MILFSLSGFLFSQDTGLIDSNYYSTDTTFHRFRTRPTPVPAFTIIAASFFYILNPVIIYEDNKIGLGITKQFSIGLGYFGEDRFTLEYSKIFRENNSNIIRIGYTSDKLLRDNLYPSNLLQGTSVISRGIAYYTDFSHNGICLETGYGYSIRNHKLLIFLHLKLRYTHIFEIDKSDVVDFSFGITVGIANPFREMKIRRYYKNRSEYE